MIQRQKKQNMEEVSSTTGLHLNIMDANLLPQQRKLQPSNNKHQKRQLIDMHACLQEASAQETFEQFLNNDNNESDNETTTPSGMKIVMAPQRFQRQVQVGVFLEGLRHLFVRKQVSLQKCEENFSNQLKKLLLTFDYSAPSKLVQQALDTEQAFKLNSEEYPYLIGGHHQVKKSLSVQVKGNIKMTSLLKKVDLYNPEDLSKITDKYFNPCTTELFATSDYLPSFKAMIGGSDYHLFSRENVQCEEQLLLSRHHQFMRKNIKRVSAQTASASPDIKHIQEMEIDKKNEGGEISTIPTYLRQTESIKLKRVVRKEKNESEQANNPVFHLHTLDMIDNGNMIPHDSSRQLNSSPPVEGQKKADKIEKINLFSQIIKKETDQSQMVQDMISHKQFKSDRRANPDSPTTGFFGSRAKPISSGPFRVTDIIKRLKSKYPNKKQHAHVLKFKEEPLKNEDEQQIDYQCVESRDMQHDRDADQGQTLLDEQDYQHEETIARNESSNQHCMDKSAAYIPFNTSVYGGCEQQQTNDGLLFKLASYDSNMLANQQIVTREVNLVSRSGLLVGGRGLPTNSPTTDLINLNDELVIAGTTYFDRRGQRIKVYEQTAEDQHGSILQERVKFLQKLSEHQYQDKRQNSTLGPWNQGDQQLNLLKKAQQIRSENQQYISSSLPHLSKQQIELAAGFQRQDSIGYTERKVNNSAGNKSPLFKRIGTKIFTAATAHKRYSSLDNDQIYKRLAKSSLDCGSPNVIVSNRGEPRGAALHSECLDFIIAETEYYKQQQSLQMIKAGLSVHAQTPEQVKNQFSKFKKKVRCSSQLEKNDKKTNDQNYTILTQRQIALPVVGQNTIDTQQKQQDMISRQRDQNDYKNQRIAKLVDDHMKHRYSLMIKRLGNAQSVVVKHASNGVASAGPSMIDVNKLDMDSSDEEKV